MTDANGFFQFNDLKPGIRYRVTVSADNFSKWTSPLVTLNPGQRLILTGVQLHIAQVVTTVTVASSPASLPEIAAEQLKIEEKQRVFGIIPNFYVVYDHYAVPLTPKLKFRLALKTSIDPVTIAGIALFAGIYQAADYPDYVQGAKGYGERFGVYRCRRFYRHHDRRRHPAIASAPGPALLLPGHGHKEVSRSPRTLLCIRLQGRQRTVAAELLEPGWRSGRGCHLECLLSVIESRRGAGIREFPDRHRRAHGRQHGTGVHLGQVHVQRQKARLVLRPNRSILFHAIAFRENSRI